jgi:autoinducer 2-degrading protein
VSQISIIVEYELLPGSDEDFAAMLKDHARRSLLEEDGCLRFDVLKPVGDDGAPVDGRMLVSEIYVDRAAVDVHMANPRLAALRATMAPMLKSRRLIMSTMLVDRVEETGIAPEDLNASNDD